MADGSFGPAFDWKSPDYIEVFNQRIRALQRIREDPACLPDLKAYYRDHPADFISDWGCTFDPRNVERGLPATVPFVLFPKQREWIEWVVAHWRDQKPGLVEKSRDMGMSWLTIAFACTMCLFNDGLSIGFGSRKEEYVDRIDSPKSLFYKARMFMRMLPPEFRGNFNPRDDAPFMRLSFRDTGSNISGEAGDAIGRGDRAAIYFVDEAAHLLHPDLVDAALSQTTNCQIDLSSVNGSANAFARKRWGGKVDVFIFDWRDDPRKDQSWYDKQVAELDPVILAQEVDRDYSASVEGVVIPGLWVRAAIDAHIRLGIKPTGARWGALDVADEGRDANAFCGAHGIVIEHIEEWSGKNSDIFATVQRAFALCDELGYASFTYDSDGLGAGVRGDARVINDPRPRKLEVQAFRGSEAVINPSMEDVKGRKNEDYFANRKAQAWMSLRRRFQATFRAIQRLDGASIDDAPVAAHDDLISISSACPAHLKLVAELSQPTYSINGAGKILIDKAPDGTKSPNLADAVMIRFSGANRKMVITPDMIARAARR